MDETHDSPPLAHPLDPLSDAEASWPALAGDLSGADAQGRLSRHRARLWALTLTARHLPHHLQPCGRHWQLRVPPETLEAALFELRRYEEENRNWPPQLPPPSPMADNLLMTVSVLVLLATFHNLLQLDSPLFGHLPANWLERGCADAGAIKAGEWWRCVTALTLHADHLHLLGNVAIGGVFILLLCRALGSGLAWALILAAGSIGNALNAWLHTPLHRSVGASTAVFGTVGLLAAIGLLRNGQPWRRRWFLPLAAAVALLALLGSEGENTDLGAHLCGFAAGLGLGLPAGYYLGRAGRPATALNIALVLACLILIGGAWGFALH